MDRWRRRPFRSFEKGAFLISTQDLQGLLSDHDVEGLIKLHGAPLDEYDEEAEKLVQRLRDLQAAKTKTRQ
jgi:hypothetical protein